MNRQEHIRTPDVQSNIGMIGPRKQVNSISALVAEANSNAQ